MRSKTDSRLTRLRVAVFAIAIVLIGACGGESKTDAEKAQERARENFTAEGLVEAGVVVRAYDEGRLGTQAEVEVDMEPYFNPPDFDTPIPKPFDNDGDLIPLGEMNLDQVAAFSQWYSSSEKVTDVVGPEVRAAVIAFREAQKSKDDS